MASVTKAQQAERAAALETLRELIEASDGTVYTILRHVSSSGMSRVIDPFVIVNGLPRRFGYRYTLATGARYSDKHDGVILGGCGMDMGFALVYSLGRALWPNGYECTGEKCRSNDHSNGDRDRTPGHTVHSDGGYRLEHHWF